MPNRPPVPPGPDDEPWPDSYDEDEEQEHDAGPADDQLTEAEIALYDKLADEDFADNAFELLAVPLVAYARPRLIHWTARGHIFAQCARHCWPLAPTTAERAHLAGDRADVEDLVNETLALGLKLLRDKAVAGERKWSRTGGASLTTYYLTSCVLSFPNLFRRWRRAFQDRPIPTRDDHPAFLELAASDDPEEQVVFEIYSRTRLDDMPPKIRRIVELRLDGWSLAEIAELTGACSARAVEGALRRCRDELGRRGDAR